MPCCDWFGPTLSSPLSVSLYASSLPSSLSQSVFIPSLFNTTNPPFLLLPPSLSLSLLSSPLLSTPLGSCQENDGDGDDVTPQSANDSTRREWKGSVLKLGSELLDAEKTEEEEKEVEEVGEALSKLRSAYSGLIKGEKR